MGLSAASLKPGYVADLGTAFAIGGGANHTFVLATSMADVNLLDPFNLIDTAVTAFPAISITFKGNVKFANFSVGVGNTIPGGWAVGAGNYVAANLNTGSTVSGYSTMPLVAGLQFLDLRLTGSDQSSGGGGSAFCALAQVNVWVVGAAQTVQVNWIANLLYL